MWTYQEYRDFIGENGQEGIERYRRKVAQAYFWFMVFVGFCFVIGIAGFCILIVKLTRL